MRHPLTLAAALILGCTAGPAAADAELTVRLSAGPSEGRLRVELANDGDRPITVLRTGTVLDPAMAEDAFDIRRAVKGWPAIERPVYTGRLYKRAPPGPDDFVRIEPGRSVSSTLALADHYDVPAAGDYRVRFDGAFRTVPGAPFDDGNDGTEAPGPAVPSGDLVDVVPATAGDGGALELELRPDANGGRARPPAFAGCGSAQREAIVEATGAAEGLAADALDSLGVLGGLTDPGGVSAPRYERWFGAWTDARHASVKRGFDAILGALSGETLGLDCTCTEEGVFAYVYPSRPYDVYLCPTFFRADVLGSDSRAGTLVHELSHFTNLVGTADHRYGQSAVAALAADDPDRAIENADNLEYFAENTPALPTLGDDASGDRVDPDAPANPDDPDANVAPVPDPSAQRPDVAALTNDVPVRGTLGAGEFALFRTDGADAVSLRSVSGDADLYVFESAALDGGPVCSADAFSAQSTLDACELPSVGTWHAVVVGFEDTDYEITATALALGSTAAGAGPEAAPDAPATDSGTPSPADGGGALGAGGITLLCGVAALRRRVRRHASGRSRPVCPARPAPAS